MLFVSLNNMKNKNSETVPTIYHIRNVISFIRIAIG